MHSLALKETFWNHVLLRLTPSKQLMISSKPSQYEKGNEDFLIAFTPPMLIRCRGLAYLNFLLLSKKGKKEGGRCERENVFAWPLPFFRRPTILLLLPVIHEWRGEKNALLRTRWEHSTWPNQSITLVGRRCDTAVQQHTISQSIRHKHMVTNQWHPEDPWGWLLHHSLPGSWLMTS